MVFLWNEARGQAECNHRLAGCIGVWWWPDAKDVKNFRLPIENAAV
jgi:hypothetical protein